METQNLKNYSKIENDGTVCHLYETSNGLFAAICYHGKSKNPTIHKYFKTEEEREKVVRNHFAFFVRQAEFKAEQRAQKKDSKKNEFEGVSVGDVFYRSWGYEQTNVDFYQVVKVNPASIVIRHIKAVTTQEGFMSGYAVPVKDEFDGAEERRMSLSCLMKFEEGKRVSVSWYG